MKIFRGGPVSWFDFLVAFVPVCLIGGAFYVCSILVPPQWESFCQKEMSRGNAAYQERVSALCEKHLPGYLKGAESPTTGPEQPGSR